MKYRPKHSTLVNIWARTGENAVFFVPPSTPEALLGRPNTGQGKRRDTERICLTAVPVV